MKKVLFILFILVSGNSFGQFTKPSGSVTIPTYSFYRTAADSTITIYQGSVNLYNTLLSKFDSVKVKGYATNYKLQGYVIKNAPITASTKTKITYDAKGLVTAGADATTYDITQTGSRGFITPADSIQLDNLATNLSNKVDKVTGKSLVADTEISKIHASGSDNQDLSGLAPISGGANYIQNQNASAQSANMWIGGSGRIGTYGMFNGDVDSNSDNIVGHRIYPLNATGNVYIDSKVYTGGHLYNRIGSGTSQGLSITYLDINGANGSATFSSTVNATQFQSTTLTGTAPLTVSSTTLNTNLNADLFDGLHKLDYLSVRNLGNENIDLNNILNCFGSTNSGDYPTQLNTPTTYGAYISTQNVQGLQLYGSSFSDLGNSTSLYFRTKDFVGGTMPWNAWKKVWDSANLINPTTGSGTTNYIPKWTSGSTLGNSKIYEDGGAMVTLEATNKFVLGYNQNGGTNQNSPKLAFYGQTLGSSTEIYGPSIQKIFDASYGYYARGRLAIIQHNGNDYTHEQEVVSILPNGNVGIGTTNASEKLHVVGNGLFSGNMSVYGISSIYSGNIDGQLSTVMQMGNLQYPLPLHKWQSATSSAASGNILALRIATGNSTDAEIIRFNGTGTINIPSLSGTGTRMVVADSGGTLSTQTIPSGSGGGTVVSVGVTSGNGFAGTSSGGVNPALTLSTTVSGVLYGNGTAMSSASSANIISALGYTPYNSTNPSGYITSDTKWDGGSTGLTASTGRTSLGLGGLSTTNISVQALSGTTPSWSASSGINATLTLSGNTTITLSNLTAGTSGNIKVTNPATTYTLTFSGYTNKISSSVWSATNVVKTSGSSKIDMYSWYYDGTHLIWNGSLDYK